MKRPTMLVEAILAQASLDLDLSVERDVVTLRRRIEHEGFSFLTIILPMLSDSLEQGLEHGLFSCPTNFRRRGRLPVFLQGFFKRVFDLDGNLLDDACPISVFYIRQICRFFKKTKDSCSDSRNRAAIQHFVDVEGELRHVTPLIERKDIFLDKVSGIIWSQVFPEIDYVRLVCHHGPGYTADKLSSNGRYRIRNWNQRSEFLFPSDLHCYPNYGIAASVGLGIRVENDEPLGPNYLRLREEMPVRVVFVPKTQTTPRVIAIEPSHVQYMQQSVKDYVYEVLESHRLTKRSIRFSRQDVNQSLAYRGSIDKRTSTLDLKDASDRVHLHLVQRIFKNSDLLQYLEDARSLHATLPDGRNLVLFKYASMGSALCFPVEAMVFYTLIQSAMHQVDGRIPCSQSIEQYSKSIDIYGDDIIVPVEYTDAVVHYLESYALKVNVGKSFTKGNFRESCGADFFKGVAVNPVYARQTPHDDVRRWGPEHVMSWVASADLFYMRGMWVVAQAIRDMVHRVVRRPIPLSREHGPGLYYFSYIQSTDLRYDVQLHGWKQKRIQYQPTKKKDNIDGDELACLNLWGIGSSRLQRNQDRDIGPNPARYRNRYQHTFSSANGRKSLDAGFNYPAPTRLVGSSARCVSTFENRTNDAGLCAEGLQELQVSDGQAELNVPSVSSMACSCGTICACSNASRERSRSESGTPISDYCLTEAIQRDPLYYLAGDISGINFLTSTKRGAFKSKRRWVSLAG